MATETAVKKLARIKNLHFGVGDYGHVQMWFDAYISEHVAALQVLGIDAVVKMLQDAGVRDINELNGRNVWVEEEGPFIKYVEYAKI